MTRYALYFAPAPGSALDAFGRAWLGRDARTDAAVRQPRLRGISADRLTALTVNPRRYGFHATLKAPFCLAEGTSASDLAAAAGAFSRGCNAVTIALQLAEVDGFLALVEREQSAELRQLAERVVRDFDGFRAAPSAAQIARRAPERLAARERELLTQWGYPYVFDRWRFHLTLTDRLDATERAAVRSALEPLLASIVHEPLTIDAIALFRQAVEAATFIECSRSVFGHASVAAQQPARSWG